MNTKYSRLGTFVPLSALSSTLVKESGTFASGREFTKWLERTGQKAWQLLPIQETQLEPGSRSIHVTSPYKSYGVGLSPQFLSKKYCTYNPSKNELEHFVSDNADWIGNYTLFCSLRDYYQTDDWSKWDPGTRDREPETLAKVSRQLEQEIRKYLILQYRLEKDFEELKREAQARNISMLGDLPFYITYASPLVWAKQDLFELNNEKQMEVLSGLPDGPKAHFGRQIWGHPLYKWGKDDNKIVDLWKIRIKYFAKHFEMVRLDHAKGLFNYGVMDVKDPAKDQIRNGPGEAVLTTLIKYAKELGMRVFAEDSGDRLEKLREVLAKKQIPGIRVLSFALTVKNTVERVNSTYAETKNYPKNVVAYTTTHDTETLMGYLKILSSKQKETLAKMAGVSYQVSDRELAVNLREAVVKSPAQIVIIPIQDWLLSQERINVPGTEAVVNDPNWRYKLDVPIEELKIGE